MKRHEAIRIVLNGDTRKYETPDALREDLLARALDVEKYLSAYHGTWGLAAGLVLGMKRSFEGAWMGKTTSYWTAHARPEPGPEPKAGHIRLMAAHGSSTTVHVTAHESLADIMRRVEVPVATVFQRELPREPAAGPPICKLCGGEKLATDKGYVCGTHRAAAMAAGIAEPEPGEPAHPVCDNCHRPLSEGVSVAELLMYADALCDVTLTSHRARIDGVAVTIGTSEPDDPETLGQATGRNAEVALVRAFVDLIRNYGLVYGDGTLEKRAEKLGRD